MKKKTLLIALVASITIGCSDDFENLIETEKKTEKVHEKISTTYTDKIEIDPEKDCPQNDRNCNGIPDSKE